MFFLNSGSGSLVSMYTLHLLRWNVIFFIFSGDKYEAVSTDNGYKKYMMLKIRNVGFNDFGSYKCVAKNSLGETDGVIKLEGKQKCAIKDCNLQLFWYGVTNRSLFQKFLHPQLPEQHLRHPRYHQWKEVIIAFRLYRLI